MATNFEDTIVFTKAVRFDGTVEFAGGESPEFSLANIDSLDMSGSLVAAGAGQFGTDVSVGDDLTVVDDATIGGDLSVTGPVILGSTLSVTGNVESGGALTIAGATILSNTLTVSGAITADSANSTLRNLTCQALTATGASSLGSTLAVTDAATLSSTLAVAGASTLHNTSIIGTLGVSSTSTLAATSATALTASSSLTLTGASVVGLHDYVTLDIATLAGAGATVYGFPSPVAGTIVKIQSRLKDALTTGDATITGKIGATGITNGVITITQSGSAAGDIDVANPTAANTVVVGSNVSFTVGGTNDAVVGATLTVTFLRSA